MTLQEETIQRLKREFRFDDLTARFTEIVLLVDLDDDFVKLLPDEVEIICAYRNERRIEKDFKTSDYLRGVLERANHKIKDSRAS